MKRAKLTLVVENNATGQLAKLIKLFVGDVIRAELAAAPGKAVAIPWCVWKACSSTTAVPSCRVDREQGPGGHLAC